MHAKEIHLFLNTFAMTKGQKEQFEAIFDFVMKEASERHAEPADVLAGLVATTGALIKCFAELGVDTLDSMYRSVVNNLEKVVKD